MGPSLKKQDNLSAQNNKRKSILFVIGGLGVGGKERQLIELIHGLPRRRYDLHLLIKNCDAYYLKKVKEKLSTFHNLNQQHFRLFDFITFAKHIDQLKPDIVCSWTNITSHFSLLAKMFTSHSYKIINCCIRSAPSRLNSTLKFERFMYSFYKTVVANSRAGLLAYGQQNRKGRHILYNGFDFSRLVLKSQDSVRRELGFPVENTFIVVMVASLTNLKDHETFLQAAKVCTEKSQRIRFYIVGDGPRRDVLEKMAVELDLCSNLMFLGKRDDVEDIFMAADLSVLTSTSWFGEGISNSIIESMGCGTPVIASESPGTMEIIEDGTNGFLIPCGKHQALAAKIIELSRHPKTMQMISTSGKATVEEKFSIDQLIKTFMNIIDNC